MNIFNSLGSNYDWAFVLKALFVRNKASFKSNLKAFLEKKYGGKAILVYKGREAIGLALEILNFPKGSFVAINGFTCYAVYKAVSNKDCNACILDLDNSLDLNFTPELLQKKLKENPKIKTVIIQNTLGYPCNIEKIAKVCRENNIILIEDLAHSVGTKYLSGKEAGTIGDFVVLSFSQDKIIDAVSGGALIIRNKKYQDYCYSSSEVSRVRRGERSRLSHALLGIARTISKKQQLLDRLYPLFTFIIRKTYPIGLGKLLHFLLKTFNLLLRPMNEDFYERYSLPNWYAYLVLDAFNKLSKNLEHRKKISTIYNSILDKKITSDHVNKNIPLSSNLRCPIFVENRKDLINYLKKEGIHVSDIWYDDVDKNLPNAQIAANTILNLPTHRNVLEEDAKNIAQKINHFILRASPDLRRDESRSILANSSRLTPFARTINSKEEWESFLALHPESNFLQSWHWGEFHQALTNNIQRTGFYEGNKLVGVMLSVVEKAKRGRYLTVPGGPIIDWQNPNLVDTFVKKIKNIAKEQNCVFVRVRPQLESSKFSKSLFKRYGFINAPMHLHAELTSQLDITKPEDELLKGMRKTTRYEIKKAIKQGIKVTVYSSSEVDASTESRSLNDISSRQARTVNFTRSLIKEFYDLQMETARRQKFVPFSYNFLYEQFKVFADTKHALLYNARFNSKLLAQAFVIFYGKEAVYHYGASTDEGRRYPGAHLIQWEAILEAKKRGMTRYNFWGVSPTDKPDHRFSGLSLFKRGFGGQDFEYLHAQDLIINKPKY